MMKPIVPPKYSVGFVVENCTKELLEMLEFGVDNIYGDFERFRGIL